MVPRVGRQAMTERDRTSAKMFGVYEDHRHSYDGGWLSLFATREEAEAYYNERKKSEVYDIAIVEILDSNYIQQPGG